LWKQVEVFLARATKLFSVNMTNIEWDKKECVLNPQSGSQVRSRFHQKEPEKLETQMRKGGHSQATDRLLARGAKLCDQVGLCHRLWRVDSYAFHPAERLAQASGS
jgi:hypothetical protein